MFKEHKAFETDPFELSADNLNTALEGINATLVEMLKQRTSTVVLYSAKDEDGKCRIILDCVRESELKSVC